MKRNLVIHTMHGDIYTPAFGPDATRGLIKGLSPNETNNLSGQGYPLVSQKKRKYNAELQFILSNTYHLRSYPGDDYIFQQGGLHKFMMWDKPILTDSGGYQVFSLIHGSKNLKGQVTEHGAFFKNPITGEKLDLTPENAIDIQFKLGSDIMVVLDDCRHYKDREELTKSVYRTIEWAKRSKRQFYLNIGKYGFTNKRRPLLFAVVQGGIDYNLREYCVRKLVDIGFDGYGFGGWAINDKVFFPYDMLKFVANLLPDDKPRYAMGVGTPENILQCVEDGYDLFDCVIPSRNGRHGLCYTSAGEIKIRNSKYKQDSSLLDEQITSIASNYPKKYLYHLFKIGDPLAGRLLTIHNLKYYNHILSDK